MQALLTQIAANRRGEAAGIYSVCSAHALVIEAAMEQAAADGTVVLIEATANQVNQFGGYTGMKPADFVAYVHGIAARLGFPHDQILLGGDRLGPVCWQADPAEAAMAKAADLITAYVAAGFKKIHLDCSMACAGDSLPLDDAVIAGRAAFLCAQAETTAQQCFGMSDIVYIVGTEVPPPGGADEAITSLEVTDPAHARQTLQTHHAAFEAAGLADVWPRVIGLVVQPGVEFDHTSVIDYVPHKATALKALIPTLDHVVFEAHSTDYQTAENYHHLVRDHFAILKVGPQLTFALREALFALSHIEDALFTKGQRSNLRDICEHHMQTKPQHWQRFYHGTPAEQALLRRFSYSDRIRYYWPEPAIDAACKHMFANLTHSGLPLPLISQYLPVQYQEVRNGTLDPAPAALVKARVKQVTETYAQACWKQRAEPKE